MILLSVKEAKEFGLYRLCDKQKNEYEIAFQFFGGFALEKGDEIFINEKYLDKRWANYAQPYAFTAVIKEVYKKDKNFSQMDYISAHKRKTNEDVVLKRVYG